MLLRWAPDVEEEDQGSIRVVGPGSRLSLGMAAAPRMGDKGSEREGRIRWLVRSWNSVVCALVYRFSVVRVRDSFDDFGHSPFSKLMAADC